MLRDLLDVEKITSIIAVLSIFIEISPIKIKPISLILRWVANCVNKEIHSKLNDIEKITTENRNTIDVMKKDIDDRFDNYEREKLLLQAERMRNQIINFAENIRLGRRYSCKQYEHILSQTSKYEKHCEDYNIENHYIESSVAFIKKNMNKCVYHDDEESEE